MHSLAYGLCLIVSVYLCSNLCLAGAFGECLDTLRNTAKRRAPEPRWDAAEQSMGIKMAAQEHLADKLLSETFASPAYSRHYYTYR